jgi:hydrogenase maturation protease
VISDSTPCDDVVIIGYGNTLRGDDGLGWIAAEFLAGVIQPCQAWVITCHQLTIDLAEALSKSTLAILIDACVGAEPGLITCDDIQPGRNDAPSLHHHMPPESLLACTEALYGRAPRTVLITVTGESFEFGSDLSPAVKAALPVVIKHVKSLLPDTV